MNSSINLLATKNQNTRNQLLSKFKLLRIIAISILVVVGVSSMALFFLIAQSPLPALKSSENELLSKLGTYSSKLDRLMLLKDRLSQISQYQQGRAKYDKLLSDLLLLLPSAVTIDAVSIEKKTLAVSFSSSSLTSLNQLIGAVIGKTGKGGDYTSVSMESLTMNEQRGVYILALELTL